MQGWKTFKMADQENRRIEPPTNIEDGEIRLQSENRPIQILDIEDIKRFGLHQKLIIFIYCLIAFATVYQTIVVTFFQAEA